jgi:hypothetical protein
MGRTDLDGQSLDDDPEAAPVVLHERHQALEDRLLALNGQRDAELIAALIGTRREMRRLRLIPPDFLAEQIRTWLTQAERCDGAEESK